MKTVIQILAYNAPDYLQSCLESLEWTSDISDIHIIVIDNASDYPCRDIVKKLLPKAEYLRNNDNVGFGNGHNIGYAAARKYEPEYLLLLNPDARLTFQNYSVMIEKFQQYKQSRVGIVAPKVLNDDDDLEYSIHKKFNVWKIFLQPFGFNLTVERSPEVYSKDSFVVSVSGACMLIDTKMIEEIGLFDKNYFMYLEDGDLCTRAAKAGWKVIYTPDTEIYHALGKSSEIKGDERGTEYIRKGYLYKSEYTYAQKHLPKYEVFLMKYGRILEMTLRLVFSDNKKWSKNMLNYFLDKKI